MRLIKTFIKLAILFAIGHAAYKGVPAYWHYVQFRDEVAEVARFSSGKTENDIRERVAKERSRATTFRSTRPRC